MRNYIKIFKCAGILFAALLFVQIAKGKLLERLSATAFIHPINHKATIGFSNVLADTDPQSEKIQDELNKQQVTNFLLTALICALLIIFYFLSKATNKAKKAQATLTKKNHEIKEINEQLKLKNEEIEAQRESISAQNQQLRDMHDELNMLLSIVAHDLRSPLNNIQGLLKLIEMNNCNLTTDQKKYLNMILSLSLRLGDMVSKILDSNKLESNILGISEKNLDILTLLQEVINTQSAIARQKGIEVCFHTVYDDCLVVADENLVIQVLENLISNAIKFSPLNSNIKVVAKKNDEYVQIEVIDEGPGISADDMKMMFGKYKKLSARPTAGEPSLGLGLSLVKRYVEIMNGKIWCKSTEGAGATFIFQLPQA